MYMCITSPYVDQQLQIFGICVILKVFIRGFFIIRVFIFRGAKMDGMDENKNDEGRQDEVRPREINIVRFAKERVAQIAQLLDVSGILFLSSAVLVVSQGTA